MLHGLQIDVPRYLVRDSAPRENSRSNAVDTSMFPQGRRRPKQGNDRFGNYLAWNFVSYLERRARYLPEQAAHIDRAERPLALGEHQNHRSKARRGQESECTSTVGLGASKGGKARAAKLSKKRCIAISERCGIGTLAKNTSRSSGVACFWTSK